MTLYRCRFTDYFGQQYLLDTTDQAKIGPWLAEMFGLFPYDATTATSLDIRATKFATS